GPVRPGAHHPARPRAGRPPRRRRARPAPGLAGDDAELSPLARGAAGYRTYLSRASGGRTSDPAKSTVANTPTDALAPRPAQPNAGRAGLPPAPESPTRRAAAPSLARGG